MATDKDDQKPYSPGRDHRGFIPSRSFASTVSMADIDSVVRTLFVDGVQVAGAGYVDVSAIGSAGNPVVQEIVIGIRREQAAYRTGVPKESQTRGIDALVDPYTDVTYVDRLQLFDWLHDMRTRLAKATGVSADYSAMGSEATIRLDEESSSSDGAFEVLADSQELVRASVR